MPSMAALQIILKARDEASKVLQGAGGSVSRFGGAFKAAGVVALGAAAGVGAAVVGLGAAALKLARDAAPVEGLAKAFEGIAATTELGVTGMMAALKEGSAGMISQRDLMMSFNKAASLVSVDFAEQLPDAMGYLAKVSAATGQDVGFLMDSLVTGVGRLSPMILDNLAIQVAQSEATERATEMYGLQADELSKTQIQAGMMNVVMEKLAANTADIPDVAGGAAASLAQWGATIQDTKDRIGVALLPTLSNLMGTLSDLVARVLPPVTTFLENTLAPALEMVTTIFGTFVGGLLEGQGPAEALRSALEGVVPPDLVDKIMGIVDTVSNFIEKAVKVVEPIMKWIGENVALQDVLIALGAAIAFVVIPAIASVVAAAAPVIGVFLLVVAAVAALRAAWESNFLGIRDVVQTVWAAIQKYISWAVGNLKAIIDFFSGDTKASIAAMWESVKSAFRNALSTVVGIAQDLISKILDAFSIDWGETGRFIIDGIIGGIKNGIGAIKDAVRNVAQAALDAAKRLLGIGSASKKARALIGTPFGEGVEEGILAGIPRIMAAAREVGSALLTGAQGPERGLARVGIGAAQEGGLGAALATPGGGGIVIHNYFGPGSVRSDDDIEQIMRRQQELFNIRGLREFEV